MTPTRQPIQRTTFHPFGSRSLSEIAGLDQADAESPRQLNYLESYLGKLDCATVVLEAHYVDRDHMEDHSVFYSRNLAAPQNYCQRLHFFKASSETVRRDLKRLLLNAATLSKDGCAVERLKYSRDNYLGFAVIRPLAGSPVGRTIVACYPPKASDGAERSFDCARDYTAHLLGVGLTVRGLVFQQQDVGVSACATTAVWSALSKARAFETLALATPVQITTMASRHTMPFGRAIPSEAGLSVDQMCQAVQAAGVTPELLRLVVGGKQHIAASVGRNYLYSAVRSGFAPVLVLNMGGAGHAVTVVGMKMRDRYIPQLAVNGRYDLATNLEALYVHDDRHGPGVLGELKQTGRGLNVRLRVFYDPPQRTQWETWSLTHVLLPLHAKIRFSFLPLQDLSVDVADYANGARDFFSHGGTPRDRTLTVSNWICQAPTYLQDLLRRRPRAEMNRVEYLAGRVALSRYVGVIRMTAHDGMDPIDVVIDTTSTKRNRHLIGVFPLTASKPETNLVASWVASQLQSKVIGPSLRGPHRVEARHQQ